MRYIRYNRCAEIAIQIQSCILCSSMKNTNGERLTHRKNSYTPIYHYSFHFNFQSFTPLNMDPDNLDSCYSMCNSAFSEGLANIIDEFA